MSCKNNYAAEPNRVFLIRRVTIVREKSEEQRAVCPAARDS